MEKGGPFNRWAGKALQVARKGRGKQGDFAVVLAGRLGLPAAPSRGAYGHWETGTETVPAIYLIAAAEERKMSVSELLDKALGPLPHEDVKAIEALRSKSPPSSLGEDEGGKKNDGGQAFA